MIEVGRLCYKIAGREAGKPCIIIDVIDDKYVLIDGLVRRKRCNVTHLEFTPLVLKVGKKASTPDVQKALIENHVITEVPKKGEKKQPKLKPVKQKIVHPKKEEAKKEAKPAAKKIEKKEAKKPAVKKASVKKSPAKKKAPAKKKEAKKPAGKKAGKKK